MITVHASYNLPPFAKGLVRDFRVMWAQEELGLPYEFHWMDIMKGEHKLEANRAVNPFGKIPAFRDGDLKLFESGAIVHYLYDKAAKSPKDPGKRAEQLQWSFAALNTLEPSFFEIVSWDTFWKDRPGRDPHYGELVTIAQTRAADLERALGSKPYLLGGEFGPADILMTTVLKFVNHQPLVLEKAPNVRAYKERCEARPGHQRAAAKHGVGPDARAA
jgi:glutathione S-transferase